MIYKDTKLFLSHNDCYEYSTIIPNCVNIYMKRKLREFDVNEIENQLLNVTNYF